MEPDESFRAAQTQAGALLADGARVLEMPLRLECSEYLADLPEPPRTLRSGSDVLSAAQARLQRGRALLGRLLALEQQGAVDLALLDRALRAALRLHALAAEGQLGAAEVAWVAARREASAAMSPFCSWEPPLREPLTYDRKTLRSRYDPQPSAQVELKLQCPHPGCRRLGRFLPERDPEPQVLQCPHCEARFFAWLVEAAAPPRLLPGLQRFQGRTCDGAWVEVLLPEDGDALFSVAEGDLLAFTGLTRRRWELVENLATGGRFHPRRGGPCFVASAALGPQAPELEAFRAFRDQALLTRRWGRALVMLYYRWGPLAAAGLDRWPAGRGWIRVALRRVHGGLVKRGYGSH